MKERLTELYDYLRNHCGIHTQKDFAETIGFSRPVISSALNGNEAYLTESLFRKICAAYPNTFSLDYLLKGEGQLLLPHPSPSPTYPSALQEPSPTPSAPIPQWADSLISIVSQQIKENEALNRELRQSINQLNQLIQLINTTIPSNTNTTPPTTRITPSLTPSPPPQQTQHPQITTKPPQLTEN